MKHVRVSTCASKETIAAHQNFKKFPEEILREAKELQRTLDSAALRPVVYSNLDLEAVDSFCRNLSRSRNVLKVMLVNISGFKFLLNAFVKTLGKIEVEN